MVSFEHNYGSTAPGFSECDLCDEVGVFIGGLAGEGHQNPSFATNEACQPANVVMRVGSRR